MCYEASRLRLKQNPYDIIVNTQVPFNNIHTTLAVNHLISKRLLSCIWNGKAVLKPKKD